MEDKKYVSLSAAAVLLITVAALLAVFAIVLGMEVRAAHPFTAAVYGVCALLMLAGFVWSTLRAEGQEQLWRVSVTLTLAVLFAAFALWNGYLHPVLNLILVPIGASGGTVLAVYCMRELLKKAFSSYPFWLLVGALLGSGFVWQYTFSGMTWIFLGFPSLFFAIAHLVLLALVCGAFAFMPRRKMDGMDWITGTLFCAFVAISLAVALFGGHLSLLGSILALFAAAVVGTCSILTAFECTRKHPCLWVGVVALGVILTVVMLVSFGILSLALPKLFFMVIYGLLALFCLTFAVYIIKECKSDGMGLAIVFCAAFLLSGGCLLFGGYFSPLWSVLVPAVGLAAAMAFLFWLFGWHKKLLPWNIAILLWAALVLNAGFLTGLFPCRLPMIGMAILYGAVGLICFVGAVPGAIALTREYKGELACEAEGISSLLHAVGTVIFALLFLFGGYIPGWWNVMSGIVTGAAGFFAIVGHVRIWKWVNL